MSTENVEMESISIHVSVTLATRELTVMRVCMQPLYVCVSSLDHQAWFCHPLTIYFKYVSFSMCVAIICLYIYIYYIYIYIVYIYISYIYHIYILIYIYIYIYIYMIYENIYIYISVRGAYIYTTAPYLNIYMSSVHTCCRSLFNQYKYIWFLYLTIIHGFNLSHFA